MTNDWVLACSADDIDDEDVLGFEHAGFKYAIYNRPKGFFATAGVCTHEYALMEDGLVIGQVIECPLHQGRFDVTSGKALSAPACIDLETFPTRIEGGNVYIKI